jgi:hypothetical protein
VADGLAHEVDGGAQDVGCPLQQSAGERGVGEDETDGGAR